MRSYGPAGAGMLSAAPAGTIHSIGGRLEWRGACLVVAAPDGVILPLWPPGTRVIGGKVVTPNLSGRRPTEIGGVVMLEGRFLFANDGSLEHVAGPGAAACAPRGFIVERARPSFIAGSGAELAADSDAVLLLKVDAVNSALPAEDGFRTTIAATVKEVLKGTFRPGQQLRIRHVYGQGSPMLAHPPHIPRPGEAALLFVNADVYAEQAEARGGKPLPGRVGAGGGLFRVVGGRILNDADIAMPATVAELRAQIGAR